MVKKKTDNYGRVWDVIADTPEEAANLRLRSQSMDRISAIVEESGWSPLAAANHCGVTRPRIDDLLYGRI
jgi:predicted XRE-type DNA-binding protein